MSPDMNPDREAFERDGFLGPVRVYEPDEARELLHRIRLHNQDRSRALFDNDVNYDRHFDIPELTRHIGHPAIVRRLRTLLGPDVMCWRSEFFPKFPGTAGTEWHQVHDYQYATGMPMLQSTLPDMEPFLDVTVWTAFTDATRDNGCLKFLPGSHRQRFYDESKAPNGGREAAYSSIRATGGFFGYHFEDFKIDPSWVPDESRAVAMEMRAGECVMFTPRCVHGSFPNATRRTTRFAIATRYVAPHVRVYPTWTEFTAHGGHFDLEHYGVVLVAGHDRFGYNRIRAQSNRDEPFPYLGEAS